MDAQQKSRWAGDPTGSESWTRGNFTRPETNDQGSDQRYAEAALDGIVSDLLASPGGRNEALNKAAFQCGTLVGAGLLDRAEAESRLTEGAREIGLLPDEIRSTIRSGIESGIKHPRELDRTRDPRPPRSAPRPKPRHDEPPAWMDEIPPPDTCDGPGGADPVQGEPHPKHDPASIWANCQTTRPRHPYEDRKGISLPGARLHKGLLRIAGMSCDGALAIDLQDAGGELMNVQFIASDGQKRFLPGCPKKGMSHTFGELTGTILICEGVATAASLFEATGYMTIAALDAGNLRPVAETIRAAHPEATIIMCADDDSHLAANPGRTKAEAAARAVGGLLAVPSFGPDRPDWATDFNDLARLHGLKAVRLDIEAAEPVTEGPDPSHETPETEENFSFDAHLVDFILEGDQADAPTFAVDRILPHGEVALLSAHGGAGKSYVALLLAALVAAEKPFGSHHTRPSAVLFVSAEDAGRTLRHRLRRICRTHDIDMEELRGRLHLLDASNTDAVLHRADRQRCLPTQTLDHVADLVQRLDPGLVVLDNASDVFDGDEVKRSHVRAFLRDTRSRLAGPARAVLLLGHVSKPAAIAKTAQDFSGSTAWHNSVRSRLSLIPGKGGSMTIEHQKSNFGPLADPVAMHWSAEGVPMFGGGASQESATDETEVRRVLVDIVGAFDLRGERLPTATTGPATAFKLMKGAPEFPEGLDPERFVRLMRELERDQVIFRSSIRTGDYKKRRRSPFAVQDRTRHPIKQGGSDGQFLPPIICSANPPYTPSPLAEGLATPPWPCVRQSLAEVLADWRKVWNWLHPGWGGP
ncbi:MAG: AAA family ATPase [Magnetococcales bacterium]|nr:AAA family ATPase [Magnetococcales bacterium]